MKEGTLILGLGREGGMETEEPTFGDLVPVGLWEENSDTIPERQEEVL